MKKQNLIFSFIVRSCTVAFVIGLFSVVHRAVDALLVPLNNQITMQQLEASDTGYMLLVVLHEIGSYSIWIYLAIAIALLADPVVRLITYWRNEK